MTEPISESTSVSKVLVIDDDKDISTVISQSIRGFGFKVDSFTDPLDALSHFRNTPKQYHLVLSDVRMPGLSGIELAKEVRKANEKVKIILMTAFEISKSEFDRQVKGIWVDDLLFKPVSVERLKKIVLRHTGKIAKE